MRLCLRALVLTSLLAIAHAQDDGLSSTTTSSSSRSLPGLSLSGTSDSKIAKNVLESKGEGYCSPSGPIEDTLCAYETIEDLNKRLYPSLHSLVRSDFFRYYKVDLFRECPFWQENGFCMNRDCGVETADDVEVPESWRAKALSQVSVSGGEPPGCELHSQDFCYTDSDSGDGQYVDLLSNPERFTGYAGESAHRVWRAIYEENCFGLGEQAPAQWGQLARRPLRADTCVEKRTYYRIISGLHASISIHICHDYLDTTTGQWAPNLECFIDRLATHPERLSNVYFNAVLLLRAVARAAPYLEAYEIETECDRDVEVRGTMSEVLALARESGTDAFDEKALFRGDDAEDLRESFKQNFRNVSSIMDCTGCDKCKLWGKLQVSGLGTALKILFELDEAAFDPKRNPNLLQRSEVVALFNTLHRISESLDAVETFRRLYAETQEKARREPPRVKPTSTGRRPRRQRNKARRAPPTAYDRARGYLRSLRESCRQGWARCLMALQQSPLRGVVKGLLGEDKEREL